MILDTKLHKVRQVKSSKWHMVHRNVLSSSRLSGRRRCGKRSVTCYHFFKHSRGFLWFMLCNWLLTANNASSEAQLLINVQNQVRIIMILNYSIFLWLINVFIPFDTPRCYSKMQCVCVCVCECQNGLLSVANRALCMFFEHRFRIRERERETAREWESASGSICYCASAAL